VNIFRAVRNFILCLGLVRREFMQVGNYWCRPKIIAVLCFGIKLVLTRIY